LDDGRPLPIGIIASLQTKDKAGICQPATPQDLIIASLQTKDRQQVHDALCKIIASLQTKDKAG
jgi:hypothetical protein